MAKPRSLAYTLSAMQNFFASGTAITAGRFEEDLPAMAAQAYALSERLCVRCRIHHAVWPYLRLANMCGGPEAGAPVVEGTLRKLLAPGGRRVLIAGACDSGLVGTVARAGLDLKPEITLVDRCETSLELSRRFAAEWSLPIRTKRLDLTGLELEGFDIVYANSLLQFIAEDRRVDVLARMRRALRPGGHLVSVDNTGARIEGEIAPGYHSGYADWLIAELERRGIPLPDTRDAIQQLATDYSHERLSREGAFAEPAIIDDLMTKAGFVMRSRELLTMPLTASYKSFVAKLAKRRFLAVAQSPIP